MTSGEKHQYEAVLNGVGVFDYRSRAKILVTGPDRTGFLHAMVTNDVEGLPEYRGCYAAFLTPRGKMIADFFLYRFPDSLLLDLEGELAEGVRESLQSFIIMDDVSLQDVSEQWGHLSVQGPESECIVRESLACDPPSEELALVELPELAGWIIRKGYLHPVGFEIFLPPRQKRVVKERLLGSAPAGEVAEIGAKVRDVLRLEREIPRFGRDMDGSNYPMEARLHNAISLTKGCYVGQEVVAKATHVGGVGRLLMCLEISGNRLLEAGMALRDESGEKVGHVTSAAYSPRFNRTIAFGCVRKRFAVPGNEYRAVLPGKEDIPVRVVDHFA